MLNMRNIQTVRSPRRRANSRQAERRNDITANPVILVHALRLLHAAIQLRHVILREAHDGLNVHQHIERETEARMRRRKVFVARPRLVNLDDDEAGGECRGAHDVEEEMGNGTRALLFGRVRRLQDEGCLDGEEEAGLLGYQ